MAFTNFIFRTTNLRDTVFICDLLEEWGYKTYNILDNDFKKWNYYILVKTLDKIIVAGSNHSQQDVIDVIKKDYPDTCMNIYDMDSLHSFEIWVNPNVEKPSYKPKQFIKEALDDELWKMIEDDAKIKIQLRKFPYKIIIYRSTDGGVELEKYIKSNYPYFNMSVREEKEKDFYVITNPFNRFEQFSIYFANYSFYDSGRFQKEHPDINIYPKLITNLRELNDIFLKILDKPSYAPKKFLKESIANPELIKQLLKNGKYDVILFDPENYDEKIKIKSFLENLGTIGNLQNLNIRHDYRDYVYAIMTKNGTEHDEFRIEIFGNLMIHEFFKTYYPEFKNVSPIMTTDEFINYMNRTINYSAKSMYSPKKFSRDI